MTPRGQAAFKVGIRTAVDLALAAAVTMEIRDDAREVRQQAAVAAQQGLGDGLKAAFFDKPDPVHRAFAMIADTPGDAGTVACPTLAKQAVTARELAEAVDYKSGQLHARSPSGSGRRVEIDGRRHGMESVER